MELELSFLNVLLSFRFWILTVSQYEKIVGRKGISFKLGCYWGNRWLFWRIGQNLLFVRVQQTWQVKCDKLVFRLRRPDWDFRCFAHCYKGLLQDAVKILTLAVKVYAIILQTFTEIIFYKILKFSLSFVRKTADFYLHLLSCVAVVIIKSMPNSSKSNIASTLILSTKSSLLQGRRF